MNRSRTCWTAVAIALAALLGGDPADAQVPSTPSAPSSESSPERAPQTPDPAPPSQRYFRLPSIRFGLGSHAPLNTTLGGPRAGLSYDLSIGFTWVGSRLLFLADVGFSGDESGTRSQNVATLGGGVMVGTWVWGVGITSRALLGGSHRELAFGARNSLAVHVLAATLTLEVGHAWVHADGEDRHDFRWTVSVNPLPLIGLLIARIVFRGVLDVTGRFSRPSTSQAGESSEGTSWFCPH